MAKVVLLTDTHFGIKGSTLEISSKFHDNMELFFSNIFFPWLYDNRVDGIIHLGDVFHDRRKIDTYTAKRAREYFFEPMQRYLQQHSLRLHIICGNHDSYFKDDLATNSLSEFIANQNYTGVTQADNLIEVHTDIDTIPEWNMILIPWMTKNNREAFHNQIASSKARFALGHLELQGFSFSKVQVAMHGDDPQSFKKFERVFSGHYHYRHEKGNVLYLGSPTEQTWIDADTTRGFHVLDTETGDVEFIKNPFNIYQNVKLNEEIEGNWRRFYRLHREEDDKQSDIEAYIKVLYEKGAINVDVIQARTSKSKSSESKDDLVLEDIEDTPQFIRNNIEDPEVAEIMIKLYNKAINENNV